MRSPNPWLVGLAAIPLVAALVLSFGSIFDLTSFWIFAPHLFAIGATAMVAVLRRRPLARLREARVRADAEALHIDDEAIALGTITRALLVPDGDNRPPVVRLDRALKTHLELVVRDAAEGNALLAALGRDASRSVAKFRTLSRALAGTARIAMIATTVAITVGALMLRVTAPAVAPLLPLVIGAVVVLWLVPTRVEVGADGVLVRWLGTTRFVPVDEIEYTSQYEAGFGRNRHIGARLHLRSEETVDIPVGTHNWGAGVADTSALIARIDETLALRRGHRSADEATLLARASRPVDAWMASLRGIGLGVAENFRRAPIERERLWQVLESVASSPEARAAAAVALAAGGDPSDARRIRVTAAAVAEPRLRVAIDASTSADEAAIATALDAICANEQQRS